MTLGQLLAMARNANLERGKISGTCIVCNLPTDSGFKATDTVSGNFMGWNKFFAGDCVCPECYYLFSDQIFRKRSWVASVKGGFIILEREQVRGTLFSPPEPPFFIYIARAGQRQSWLSCLHRIAFSQREYFFSYEDYDVPILFKHEEAEEYVNLIDNALAQGITKTELRSGAFKISTWRKAHEKGFTRLLREIAKKRGNMLWEVIVNVSGAGKQDSGDSGADIQRGELGQDANEQKST